MLPSMSVFEGQSVAVVLHLSCKYTSVNWLDSQRSRILEHKVAVHNSEGA